MTPRASSHVIYELQPISLSRESVFVLSEVDATNHPRSLLPTDIDCALGASIDNITHVMSIDIKWETATSGPDGEALAEQIRAFIHEKFQQVPLPRFIRSVQVHSFDFGKTPPDLEIKDICDPFADFYEEDDEDKDDDNSSAASDHFSPEQQIPWQTGGQIDVKSRKYSESGIQLPHNALRSPLGFGDHLNSPFLPGAGASGIPGGTANLGYHLMSLGGLSGTQTPLAAVAAGGSSFPHAWTESVEHSRRGSVKPLTGGEIESRRTSNTGPENPGSPSRPSTANTVPSRHSVNSSLASSSNDTSNDPTVGFNEHDSTISATATHFHDNDDTPQEHHPPPMTTRDDPTYISPPHRMRERKPEDFQVVCRVKYEADITLSLTAEILLDYPMPSFVGLPLKLNITGFSFDGVAVLAYIRKRAHFCFLSPEDADALLGAEENGAIENEEGALNSNAEATTTTGGGPFDESQSRNEGILGDKSNNSGTRNPRHRFGGLLQKIRVDSEIGRKENGKQVLKNVGKVERFILDQVRRIFEDEFVYPSFWTFLV